MCPWIVSFICFLILAIVFIYVFYLRRKLHKIEYNYEHLMHENKFFGNLFENFSNIFYGIIWIDSHQNLISFHGAISRDFYFINCTTIDVFYQLLGAHNYSRIKDFCLQKSKDDLKLQFVIPSVDQPEKHVQIFFEKKYKSEQFISLTGIVIDLSENENNLMALHNKIKNLNLLQIRQKSHIKEENEYQQRIRNVKNNCIKLQNNNALYLIKQIHNIGKNETAKKPELFKLFHKKYYRYKKYSYIIQKINCLEKNISKTKQKISLPEFLTDLHQQFLNEKLTKRNKRIGLLLEIEPDVQKDFTFHVDTLTEILAHLLEYSIYNKRAGWVSLKLEKEPSSEFSRITIVIGQLSPLETAISKGTILDPTNKKLNFKYSGLCLFYARELSKRYNLRMVHSMLEQEKISIWLDEGIS